MAKIIRLEFVDMAELLRDNIEVERRRGAQGEGSNNSDSRYIELDSVFWYLRQCDGIKVSWACA